MSYRSQKSLLKCVIFTFQKICLDAVSYELPVNTRGFVDTKQALDPPKQTNSSSCHYACRITILLCYIYVKTRCKHTLFQRPLTLLYSHARVRVPVVLLLFTEFNKPQIIGALPPPIGTDRGPHLSRVCGYTVTYCTESIINSILRMRDCS